MKIVFTSNSLWNIYNFRFELCKYFINKNYKVIIFTKLNPDLIELFPKSKNLHFFNIDIESRSYNVYYNLKTLLKYISFFRKHKPNYIFSYTIKPNLFSLISCIFNSKIKVVNNITGLGTLALQKNVVHTLLYYIYKFLFIYSHKIIFQNQDDIDYFKFNDNFKNKILLVNGSGVDSNYFYFDEPNYMSKKYDFTFIGRLINEKGIREYMKAAKKIIIDLKLSDYKFNIVTDVKDNFIDKDLNQLINIEKEKNYFTFNEYKQDVRDYILNSHCIILPSYREGSSKTIIESISMGRPVITSDVPGCNNIITNNFNGLLIKPKDYDDLVKKIIKFKNLSIDKKKLMTKNCREIAISNFDVFEINKKIIDETINNQ